MRCAFRRIVTLSPTSFCSASYRYDGLLFDGGLFIARPAHLHENSTPVAARPDISRRHHAQRTRRYPRGHWRHTVVVLETVGPEQDRPFPASARPFAQPTRLDCRAPPARGSKNSWHEPGVRVVFPVV